MGESLTVGSLGSEDIKELQNDTNFSRKEILRLYSRFRNIDRSHTGVITNDEFMKIPELAVNPIAPRIIELFSGKKPEKNQVNFREFLIALSPFREKGNREEKLKFAFKVYDVDGDGFINQSDLQKVLQMMVGENLNVEELKQIVENTISEADEDKDGKLSFEEFKTSMKNFNVKEKMSIKFDEGEK